MFVKRINFWRDRRIWWFGNTFYEISKLHYCIFATNFISEKSTNNMHLLLPLDFKCYFIVFDKNLFSSDFEPVLIFVVVDCFDYGIISMLLLTSKMLRYEFWKQFGISSENGKLRINLQNLLWNFSAYFYYLFYKPWFYACTLKNISKLMFFIHWIYR